MQGRDVEYAAPGKAKVIIEYKNTVGLDVGLDTSVLHALSIEIQLKNQCQNIDEAFRSVGLDPTGVIENPNSKGMFKAIRYLPEKQWVCYFNNSAKPNTLTFIHYGYVPVAGWDWIRK